MGVLYSKKGHKKKEKKKKEECKKTKQNLFSLHMQPVSSSVVGQSWAGQPSPGHSMRLQVLTALPLPSGGIGGGWRELLLLHRPQMCKSPALMPVHSIDREPTQEQSMANRDCQGLLALGLLHPAAHHQWCQGKHGTYQAWLCDSRSCCQEFGAFLLCSDSEGKGLRQSGWMLQVDNGLPNWYQQ